MTRPKGQEADQRTPFPTARVLWAIIVISLALGYAVAVVAGLVPEGRRIDAPALAVIGLAALCALVLLKPGVFARLRVFEAGGIKVELLERIRERQAAQESELEDMALVLPLLLPKPERTHLLNLADGKASAYKGNHDLRTQLRRLRTAGLISSRGDNYVGKLTDGGTFDLAQFVELTTLGRRWVKRIRELEQDEQQDEAEGQGA